MDRTGKYTECDNSNPEREKSYVLLFVDPTPAFSEGNLNTFSADVNVHVHI